MFNFLAIWIYVFECMGWITHPASCSSDRLYNLPSGIPFTDWSLHTHTHTSRYKHSCIKVRLCSSNLCGVVNKGSNLLKGCHALNTYPVSQWNPFTSPGVQHSTSSEHHTRKDDFRFQMWKRCLLETCISKHDQSIIFLRWYSFWNASCIHVNLFKNAL